MLDPFSAQRIADRMEIEAVINGFCQANDRRDFDAFDRIFHADAICNHGPYLGPIAGLVEVLRVRHSRIALSKHHASNIMIEFADDDRALVESYCLGWVALPAADPVDMLEEGPLPCGLSTSRFIDIVTRRDGRWKIEERTSVPEALFDMEARPLLPVAGSKMVGTRRDGEDYLFQARRRLGLA